MTWKPQHPLQKPSFSETSVQFSLYNFVWSLEQKNKKVFGVLSHDTLQKNIKSEANHGLSLLVHLLMASQALLLIVTQPQTSIACWPGVQGSLDVNRCNGIFLVCLFCKLQLCQFISQYISLVVTAQCT